MIDRKPTLSVETVRLSEEDRALVLQDRSFIPTWEPTTLTKDRMWQIMWNIYDAFLCIISLALITKASLCIFAYRTDRENTGMWANEVSSLTAFLIQFNEQLVTAFTIIFVTIISTATHRYALYKAQEGGYIVDIEQLYASMSLPSTVAMVFSLRKFTKFSAILVAVWSFYYLGSQANKNEYAYSVSGPFKIIDAAYPTEKVATYLDLEEEGRSDPTIAGFVENTVKAYSYYSERSRDSQNYAFSIDMEGRILIPDIVALNRDQPITDTKVSAGWVDTKASGTRYSASLGRSLYVRRNVTSTAGKDADYYWTEAQVVGSFSFHTSYFSFACGLQELLPYEDFPIGSIQDATLSLNVSHTLNLSGGSSSGPSIVDVWSRWNTTSGGIELDEWKGPQIGSLKMPCNITKPQVEVQVDCVERGCFVNKMRQVAVEPSLLYTTPFSEPIWASHFYNSLLQSSGSLTAENPDPQNTGLLWDVQLNLENFVANNFDNPMFLTESINEALTKAVNSYYNLALNIAMFTAQDLDENYTQFEFQGADLLPQYRIYWHWLALDYCSGMILLAASIFSFWLRKHTLAPDILGAVSSLTRDNPYMPIPEGGSTLSGLDRTRYLRSVKIKIVDVRRHDRDVGKVGVVMLHGSQPVEGLQKDRKYM